MKSWQHSESRLHGGRKSLLGKWLAAPALCLCILASAGLGTAHAQSTSGKIFGQAPAGSLVTARSSMGLSRHASVKDNGHYIITSLPPGTYTVIIEKEGTTVDTRKNIPIGAGRGSEVDFACPQDKCGAP
ncbi:MAG: carboxypeptidase-like regulatory domain-containing protein [Rhodanobacter sp.]